MTSGVAGAGTSQPSQVANAGAQRDRQRARDVTGGVGGVPGGRRRPGRRRAAAPGPAPGTARRGPGSLSQQGRAAPVELAQPQEVGRVSCPADSSSRDERVLVGGGQQRVGGLLARRSWWCAPRRAGRSRTTRRRASATPRVASGRVLRRRSDAVLGPGQLLGPVGADQVGAGRRPDQQRSAGEHPERRAPPSSSRNDRCSSVWPGVASARSVSPPRSTSSPSRSPRCGNVRPPAAEASTCAPRRRRAARAGQEVGVQVGVGANAIRSPRAAAAAARSEGRGSGPPPAPARHRGRPGRPSCPAPRRRPGSPGDHSSAAPVCWGDVELRCYAIPVTTGTCHG